VIASLALAGSILLAPQTGAARPDPAAARVALHHVVAQPAFVHARAESWQSRTRRRFSEWLTDLWTRTVGGIVARRTFVLGFAWIAAAAALAVLLVWLGRLARRSRAETPLTLGADAPRRAGGRELARQAVELLRAGRTREAVRVAYRAAVQRLEEEGALKVDDSRTPREYLGLLPSPHRRRAPLSALTAAFERLWYGSRAPSADDGREIVALLQDLECLSRDRAN
jgi:uncharacterized protein (DUF1778 family)